MDSLVEVGFPRYLGPRVLLACASLVAGTAACSDSRDTHDGRLTVAVALAPLAEIVERVAGDAVDVVDLVPEGSDPHEHELTAREADTLSRVDAIFYVGAGFQPGVEKVVDALGDAVVRVDLLDVVDTVRIGAASGDPDSSAAVDPHAWLDPANMAAMARTVADTLGALDAGVIAGRDDGIATYIGGLEALSAEMTAALGACERRDLVTTHDAFAYLAVRAGLVTRPVHGHRADGEPSAREIDALVAAARADGTTTVFHEGPDADELTAMVATRLGADLVLLDPIESIPSGEDYSSLMRANIAAIAAALGCS